MSSKEESRFDVKITLRASLLGPLMAFLDNKYDTIEIHLVKTIPNNSNLPKGSARAYAIEVLQQANGHMETRLFKQKLVEHGLTKLGASSFVYAERNKEIIHRKGNHIWLKKGAS